MHAIRLSTKSGRKSGAMFSPLDPEDPIERQTTLLEKCAARALIVCSSRRKKFVDLAIPIMVAGIPTTTKNYLLVLPADSSQILSSLTIFQRDMALHATISGPSLSSTLCLRAVCTYTMHGLAGS